MPVKTEYKPSQKLINSSLEHINFWNSILYIDRSALDAWFYTDHSEFIFHDQRCPIQLTNVQMV